MSARIRLPTALATIAGVLMIGASPSPQGASDTRDYAYWCKVTAWADLASPHVYATPLRRMRTPVWIADEQELVPGREDPRELAWERSQCDRIERAVGDRMRAEARKTCSCWMHGIDDNATWEVLAETTESIRDSGMPTTLVD